MSDGLPRGARKLAAEALMDAGVTHALGGEYEIARITLTAAMPAIERHVRRQMARDILARLPERDFYGSAHAMQRCLKSAAHSGRLPDLPAKTDAGKLEAVPGE